MTTNCTMNTTAGGGLDMSNVSRLSDVEPIPLELPSIKKELMNKSAECQQRGLAHSFKWLAEIAYTLKSVSLSHSDTSLPDLDDEADTYRLAKSYFDLKEYDRTAFFAEDAKSDRLRFLHYYARYLSGEKKRLDDTTDNISSPAGVKLKHLKELRKELEKLHMEQKLDGYLLYLYGIVLKRLDLTELARQALLEAIVLEPCHWGAWVELSGHISDRHEIDSLQLPDHWIKHFFLAHTYLELQLNNEALEIYFGLQSGGLKEATYIYAQVAIAYHNLREVNQAVEYFKQLSEKDPFRLDNLDTYSNLLYVKEERVELAHLAHKTVQIDKYRTETCCVIGNYYSLRSQHEKAVTYFKRALKLNPNYVSAWTLIGHEFIELKNTNAAIQCYRHAIDVNKRDYRAWYGLGQTYEMLKMPFYCLYYYKKAQELRPNDSRMLVALGESFEKLEKLQDAMKCFWKAHCVGDVEGGIALFQLARLFERTGDSEQAASAYHQYILDTEAQGPDGDQQSKAYKFLAQYFIKKGCLEDAYHYAQKCTEFTDAREDGKAMLKEIANSRKKAANNETTMNEASPDASMNPGTSTGTGATSTAMTTRARTAAAQGRKDLEPKTLSFTP